MDCPTSGRGTNSLSINTGPVSLLIRDGGNEDLPSLGHAPGHVGVHHSSLRADALVSGPSPHTEYHEAAFVQALPQLLQWLDVEAIVKLSSANFYIHTEYHEDRRQKLEAWAFRKFISIEAWVLVFTAELTARRYLEREWTRRRLGTVRAQFLAEVQENARQKKIWLIALRGTANLIYIAHVRPGYYSSYALRDRDTDSLTAAEAAIARAERGRRRRRLDVHCARMFCAAPAARPQWRIELDERRRQAAATESE